MATQAEALQTQNGASSPLKLNINIAGKTLKKRHLAAAGLGLLAVVVVLVLIVMYLRKSPPKAVEKMLNPKWWNGSKHGGSGGTIDTPVQDPVGSACGLSYDQLAAEAQNERGSESSLAAKSLTDEGLEKLLRN